MCSFPNKKLGQVDLDLRSFASFHFLFGPFPIEPSKKGGWSAKGSLGYQGTSPATSSGSIQPISAWYPHHVTSQYDVRQMVSPTVGQVCGRCLNHHQGCLNPYRINLLGITVWGLGVTGHVPAANPPTPTPFFVFFFLSFLVYLSSGGKPKVTEALSM